ncbi:hypothetical protein Acor_52280 [Acrocarpospora corrugata]|uniref:Uncharacterized protein n=1 Tax=Acrocarpospora corrugata TaxID=35763 RepID=A0A5M3W546_9ACTN|nr:hypothetical protein Acor_52280 [Acrocarpospora corrugata]
MNLRVNFLRALLEPLTECVSRLSPNPYRQRVPDEVTTEPETQQSQIRVDLGHPQAGDERLGHRVGEQRCAFLAPAR